MLWPVEADFDGYLLRGADVLKLCFSFQYKAGPEGLVSKKFCDVYNPLSNIYALNPHEALKYLENWLSEFLNSSR
jgi:hypothetical protein